MSAHHFFVTSPIFRDEPTFADLSWLWAAITIVLIICTPMWPTYSESWVRALSDGTTPEKIFFTKMSRRGDFSKKRRFRSFSVSPPSAKSKNCYSDNFNARWLPHGSFEPLWATVKWQYWKSSICLKKVGPNPLWSQSIQDRVPQKSCF